MKLWTCIDKRKDRTHIENLFKAGSSAPYKSLMEMVGRYREKVVNEISKTGDRSKDSDYETLMKLSARLSLCDELLGLNAKIKVAVQANTSEYD